MCVSRRTFEQLLKFLYYIYFALSLHWRWEGSTVSFRVTHLFGLVATSHVLSDVLDALDGLFDLRRHHRKGHHRTDTLWTHLTGHFTHIRGFWGLSSMLAGARALLPSGALNG